MQRPPSGGRSGVAIGRKRGYFRFLLPFLLVVRFAVLFVAFFFLAMCSLLAACAITETAR